MSRRRARSLSALLAVVGLLLAAPVDAKKKPKKHKTHSGKSTGKSKAPEQSAEPEGESSSGASVGAGSGSSEGASRSEGSSSGRSEETPAGDAGEAKPSRPKKRKVAAEAEAPESEGTFVLPALDVVVGGGALFRTLSWNQDVTNSLSPYSLSPGPELRLGFEVYPVAFATGGFVGNVGLFGGFDYGLGVSSKVVSTGAKLTTNFRDLLVGIKFRIPFDKFVPYFSVAYGAQGFRLDGQSQVMLPAVSYEFIRPGIGARIWLTPAVDLDLGAAFLFVMDLGKGPGDIAASDLLPHSTAYGFDGSVSMGLRLTGPVGIRAGAELRQYGISGNSLANDMVRVGGAADRYIVVSAGVELSLDGVPAAPAAAEGEEGEEEEGRSEKRAKHRSGGESDEGEGDEGDK